MNAHENRNRAMKGQISKKKIKWKIRKTIWYSFTQPDKLMYAIIIHVLETNE